jgi:hypothetical protein
MLMWFSTLRITMVDGLVSKEGDILTPATSRKEGPVMKEEKQGTAVTARSAEAVLIGDGLNSQTMGERTGGNAPKEEVV